jgi:hypothetical protein
VVCHAYSDLPCKGSASAWYAAKLSRLSATTLGSLLLRAPEAVLRGLETTTGAAAACALPAPFPGVPAFLLLLAPPAVPLVLPPSDGTTEAPDRIAKSALVMYTSPLTSSRGGSAGWPGCVGAERVRGRPRMCGAWRVTSWPSRPSPRVASCTHMQNVMKHAPLHSVLGCTVLTSADNRGRPPLVAQASPSIIKKTYQLRVNAPVVAGCYLTGNARELARHSVAGQAGGMATTYQLKAAIPVADGDRAPVHLGLNAEPQAINACRHSKGGQSFTGLLLLTRLLETCDKCTPLARMGLHQVVFYQGQLECTSCTPPPLSPTLSLPLPLSHSHLPAVLPWSSGWQPASSAPTGRSPPWCCGRPGWSLGPGGPLWQGHHWRVEMREGHPACVQVDQPWLWQSKWAIHRVAVLEFPINWHGCRHAGGKAPRV